MFKNYCINNTGFESVNLVHFWVTNQKVTKKSAAKYYDNSMTCIYRAITPQMIVWNLVNKQMSADIYQQNILTQILRISGARGGVVVKALRYKPAGCGFDS